MNFRHFPNSSFRSKWLSLSFQLSFFCLSIITPFTIALLLSPGRQYGAQRG